jgi:CxxC motif-containing protein
MSDRLNENKFTCIMCPLGCEVVVKSDESGQITEVLGNKCDKGEKYARDEATHPLRVLTSTVAIEGAQFARLPVRTSGLIPKDRIFDCMKEIEKVKIKAPVKLGDKIIENILGLGVDVIATRDM